MVFYLIFNINIVRLLAMNKKYHLIVFGCQMNLSDSERLASVLNSLGYSKTDNEDEAIGILRMLDCGANDAYAFLLEETEDPLTTKRVIDEINARLKKFLWWVTHCRM